MTNARYDGTLVASDARERGHHHTCARCAFEWRCLLQPKPAQKHCPVDVATHVNRSGPFCSLCLDIIMAKRVAQLRGLSDGELRALWRLGVQE